MKNYHLQFDGYWREINKGYVPDFSGIYLIYTCRYVPAHNTVDLIKLIYIGQAENLKVRIAQHNENEFSDVLKAGETLCYACAFVNKDVLDLVENAIVYAEKPKCNEKLKDNYSHEDAQFKIEGTCSLMKYTDFAITTANDGQ